MKYLHLFEPDMLLGKGGLLLCTRGILSVVINGEGYTLRKGMACVVSPVLMYSVCDATQDAQIIPLMDEVELLFPKASRFFEMGGLIGIIHKPVFEVSASDYDLLQRRIFELEQLKNQMALCNQKWELYNQIRILLLASTIMQMLTGYLFEESGQTEQDASQTNDIKVAMHFILPLMQASVVDRSVAHHAEEANLCPGYFSVLVRRILKYSPKTWIDFIVTNRAKMMLRDTNLSVKQIAYSLGFEEQFSFRKYFKVNAGMSPSEYRATTIPISRQSGDGAFSGDDKRNGNVGERKVMRVGDGVATL